MTWSSRFCLDFVLLVYDDPLPFLRSLLIPLHSLLNFGDKRSLLGSKCVKESFIELRERFKLDLMTMMMMMIRQLRWNRSRQKTKTTTSTTRHSFISKTENAVENGKLLESKNWQRKIFHPEAKSFLESN